MKKLSYCMREGMGAGSQGGEKDPPWIDEGGRSADPSGLAVGVEKQK